jgi:DNA invertase Pin-like site-specific DNA recombinase
MTKGNFVAYYRVSTQRQGRSGLGLADQEQSIANYLHGCGGTLAEKFKEVESGRKKDREKLKEALAYCRKNKSVLLIAKLDRLARNVAFVSALLESKVRFVAVDMPEADATFLQMAAVFAEWEAKKISERTKAALAQARKNGKKLGWAIPNRRDQQHPASLKGAAKNAEKAMKFASNVLPIINEIRSAGISTLDGIAGRLNDRGVTTARGSQWYAATVRSVLAYQAAA